MDSGLTHDLITGVALPVIVAFVTTVAIMWVVQPFRAYYAAKSAAIEALLAYDHLYNAYVQLSGDESTERNLHAVELRLRDAALRLEARYFEVPGHGLWGRVHLLPPKLDWEGVVGQMLDFSYTDHQPQVDPWREERALCLYVLGVDIRQRLRRQQADRFRSVGGEAR